MVRHGSADDQCLGGLNFINCLDLDKYMESIDNGYITFKDTVGRVILMVTSSRLSACQRGRIVFGALNIMPIKQPTSP